jgi:hypothetical protein
LGFAGAELEMRARACIAYLSLDPSIRSSSDAERFEMLDRFQALITRP